MKIRSCVLLAGKLALSLGLVAMVFRQVDFAQVVASLAAANPAYAVVRLITALPTLLISAWRWQMLGQGALSFHSALKYILIGMFSRLRLAECGFGRYRPRRRTCRQGKIDADRGVARINSCPTGL